MTTFASGRSAPLLGFGVAQPVPITLSAAAYAGAFVYGQDGQMYFSNGTSWLLNTPQFFDRTGPNASPGRPVLVLGQDAQLAPETNVDVAIALRGIGALSIDVPDNTIAGGNKRGEAAIDFQNERTNADQVAAANRSVISGGRRNKIDTSAVTGTIGGGQDNLLSGGASATIAGGTTNVASAAQTTVGGGNGNTASGTLAVVCGGGSNVADGARSVVVGGSRGTTRGTTGRIVFSGHGGFVGDTGSSNLGTAQASLVVIRRETTTGAAGQTITTNNGGLTADNMPVMPNNSVYAFRGQVVCRQVGGSAGTVGDSKAWEISGAIKRGANAASVALLGTPTITVIGADAGLGANNSTGATLGVSANATNGYLAVNATGEADKTLRWVGTLLLTEVVATV